MAEEEDQAAPTVAFFPLWRIWATFLTAGVMAVTAAVALATAAVAAEAANNYQTAILWNGIG